MSLRWCTDGQIRVAAVFSIHAEGRGPLESAWPRRLKRLIQACMQKDSRENSPVVALSGGQICTIALGEERTDIPAASIDSMVQSG